MACCAHDHCSSDNRQPDGRYRWVLWVALVLNGSMFLTEIVAGLAAGSAALQADAVDFLSDAANYGISLFVLGLVLVWRARAALVKGVSMSLLGLWVAGNALWHAVMGTLPAAEVMGVVCAGASRQRRGRLPAVSLPGWRFQHALGLDLLAQ